MIEVYAARPGERAECVARCHDATGARWNIVLYRRWGFIAGTDRADVDDVALQSGSVVTPGLSLMGGTLGD